MQQKITAVIMSASILAYVPNCRRLMRNNEQVVSDVFLNYRYLVISRFDEWLRFIL